MAKLFPPHIDSKLPAFIIGGQIKIPFTMNRAVSLNYIRQNEDNNSGNEVLSAIIKTVQTNTIITETPLKGQLSVNENGDCYAIFNTSENKFKVGQFYKIQIAYIDPTDGEIGYYSSVGVLKCTSKPTIKISELENNQYCSNTFTGECDWGQNGDKTEKVYSYIFNVRDHNQKIVATSGEQTHNNYNDISTKSIDVWTTNLNLEKGKTYYVNYQVNTINNLTITTQSYPVVQQDTVKLDLPCELIGKLDNDEGYVSLYLRPTQTKGLDGSFVLSRASSKDNYKSWEEIYRFAYKNYPLRYRGKTEPPERWGIEDVLIWEDYTVEQGVDYIYAFQAYNSAGLYSNRMLNKEEKIVSVTGTGIYTTEFIEQIISVDFEDAFLFDGERQLKIRFNPKVSSFKTTLLESKIDTIGGKYPFIFRNGNVSYKEFPISGLISLIGDPKEKFFKGIQNNLIEIARSQTTDRLTVAELDNQLTAANFKRERDFKMEVLNWLTDGKPKVFRSPGEGNFIVRLMNTSLTPNDTLGRMLHTFQSTAYEIADFNFKNLISLGLTTAPIGENKYLKIGQIKLFEKLAINNPIQLNSYSHISIVDAAPYTIFELTFNDGSVNNIEIGGTGTYVMPIKDRALTQIKLIKGDILNSGFLNFCYYDDEPTDDFNIISSFRTYDEIKQIVGIGGNFNNDEEKYPDGRKAFNVVDETYGGEDFSAHERITDIRRQAGRFHHVKLIQRPTIICYEINKKIYYDPNGLVLVDNRLETAIYKVYTSTTLEKWYYLYGKSNISSTTEPDYRFQINNSPIIDLGGNPNSEPKTFGRFDSLGSFDEITSLYLGTGVVADLCYRVQEKTYSFENEDLIKRAKDIYINVLNNYNNNLSTLQEAYQNYVDAINDKIIELQQRG